MGLVSYVEKELSYVECMTPELEKDIMELVRLYAGEGHSGCSAGFALAYLKGIYNGHKDLVGDTPEERLQNLYPKEKRGKIQLQAPGPDRWMMEGILAFTSMEFAQETARDEVLRRKKLELLLLGLDYKPFTAIEEGKEGFHVPPHALGGSMQSERCSALFKYDDGKSCYLYALVFKDSKGACYTGTAYMPDGSTLSSSQGVNFPFTPESYYVDVVDVEVSPGNWVFYVKDVQALNVARVKYNLVVTRKLNIFRRLWFWWAMFVRDGIRSKNGVLYRKSKEKKA